MPKSGKVMKSARDIIGEKEVERLRKYEVPGEDVGHLGSQPDKGRQSHTYINMSGGCQTEANNQSSETGSQGPDISSNSNNTSAGEWTTVLGKLSKKAKRSLISTGKRRRSSDDDGLEETSQMSNTNRYAALSKLVDSEAIMDTAENEGNLDNNRDLDMGSQPSVIKNISTNTIVKDPPFCPPIFSFGVNCDLLSKLIRLAAKDCNVPNLKHRFVNLGYHKTKIYINNAKVHKLIVEQLRKTDVRAFSFAPKEFQKVPILLKGLDAETPVNEILSAIKEIVPNIKIAKISPFSTVKSREGNIPLNIFTIQLEAGESPKELICVRYLLHQRIYWEKKNHKGTIRCFRCQRFGHTGEFCAYDYRCAICSQDHDSESCFKALKVAKEQNLPIPILKCANCDEEGHSANYIGCPEYKKYKERREELVLKARHIASANKDFVNKSVNTGIKPGLSYANVAGANIPSGNLSDFLNESKNLFNIPFKDLITKIRQFWPIYQKLQSKEEKMFMYLEFVASIVV